MKNCEEHELGKAILYLHLNELSAKYFKEKMRKRWGYMIGVKSELTRTVKRRFMAKAARIVHARQ
ncbi:hypothetical protein [Pseudomonas phage PJNP053]|uniref:Uncharacterized protein n=1 Tax=Pseudomonas phage vB_Pae_AM.P2 TaxID=2731695 RepID=A0A7S6B690_9CAUD|nr:hypothetical protein AMP2_gp083 [Pseudomonas phage vB_Pae_AM.P2]